jgi:hypothetical protein
MVSYKILKYFNMAVWYGLQLTTLYPYTYRALIAVILL